MKKILFLIISCFLVLAVVRSAVGNNKPIDVKKIVIEASSEDFISIDDVLTDIQVIKYNFKTIGNMFSAGFGNPYDSYYTVDVANGEPLPPVVGAYEDTIYVTRGDITRYVLRYQVINPSRSSSGWTEVDRWLQYFGSIINAIGDVFVSVGKTVLDVFLTVLELLYKIGKFTVYAIAN